MVTFAPRVFSLVVVREHSPAYAPASFNAPTQSDTPFPDPLPSGDNADVIEALGDEIATLAAHMVRGCQTGRSR